MRLIKKAMLAAAMALTAMAAEAGTENGHEWVDLGLPSGTKWATMNIGATGSDKSGGRYSWDGSNLGAKWGGTWRLPTKEELAELLEKCECTWDDEKKGLRVKSKTNGKEIFLPAAGFTITTLPHSTGTAGHYLSSAMTENGYVAGLTFSAKATYVDEYMDKLYHYSVRPVCTTTPTEVSFRRESKAETTSKPQTTTTTKTEQKTAQKATTGTNNPWTDRAKSRYASWEEIERDEQNDEAKEEARIQDSIRIDNLPKKKVDGWRVQIYSSNLSNGKALTEIVIKDVKAEMPDKRIYRSFRSPFWKLRIGDYQTIGEAQEVAREMKEKFPKYKGDIYVVKDKINVPDLDAEQ